MRVEKCSQGCVITNIRIITEYTECQDFFPVIRIGSLPTPHPQGSAAPSPFGFKGGDTLACGGGGGGTQFRRRERHSGNSIYTIICLLPLRALLRIHVFQVALRSINMLALFIYYLIDAWHCMALGKISLKRKLFETLTM
jgi:hypothetical protein